MKQRLIDANAFKKENERLLHCDFPYLSETTLEELIDEAPTIDTEPVRHGKWVDRTIKVSAELTNIIHVCSVCGEMAVGKYRYCPHCGARMDAERKEE